MRPLATEGPFLSRAMPLGPGLARRWWRLLARPGAILGGYRLTDLRPDLVAGLTVAIVALPQAMAYASIANLPPHYGLYSAIVAAVVGSLWGSSSHLATGPTNTSSILMLSILAPMVALGSPDFLLFSSVMAILVGVFRLLFGLAGLGVLTNFVSRSVLLGFTAGAGALIAVHQLPHLLGVSVPAHVGPWDTVAAVARGLGGAHPASLAIAVATVIVTLAVNRVSDRFPGSLVALVGATLAVAWLGADSLGVEVVGEIPGVLPRPTDLGAAWGFVRRGMVGEMLTGALAIALLGLVEAVSIARTIARSSGERLDINQEFVGQGLANIGAGLLTGYTCSGSFTRSAVCHQAGARTGVSGVFTGLFILGLSLLVAPGLALLPRAGLAGVIVLVAYGMVDMRSFGRVLRTSSSESAVMLTTFAVALLFPLEFAVLSGVIFSLAMHVYRSSMPRVASVVPDSSFRHFVEQPGAPSCPQLAVVNIRGPLFFGATQHVEDSLLRNLAARPDQRYLLLRMHGVDRCDFTGLEMLEGLVRTYRQRGGDVFMVQVRPQVRTIMYESGFKDLLGSDHFLPQEEAIETLFETVIDPAVCAYRCPHRVFAECQALLKSPSDAELPLSQPRPLPAEACLDVSQVEGLLADAALLVLDVREPGEYRLGHVREARSLPLSLLFPEAPRLPRDRPILLLCRSGRRSRRAMRFLLDLGFENLWLLKGGILSWKAAGRPLEVD